MQFGQGMARTDKVLIEGPAANITIRGQADLRNQRFDQTIDVNPRAGNLLTVVGAVAGGPVGAALGAATNAVLSAAGRDWRPNLQGDRSMEGAEGGSDRSRDKSPSPPEPASHRAFRRPSPTCRARAERGSLFTGLA